MSNEPVNSTEVILRGLLSYHERLTETMQMNPGKEEVVCDAYADALKTAISCVREKAETKAP